MTEACRLPGVRALIAAALREDVGRGDLTTRLLLPPDASTEAFIVAKQGAVIAGLPLVPEVFAAAGGGVIATPQVAEGDGVERGALLCKAAGSVRTLFAGERVALNLVQHLSGVATTTSGFVRAVSGTRARIVDTRKTTPGLRILEKYAVRLGGGTNHRFGLDDGILVKKNHVAAVGGIRAAVERVRAGAPHGMKVEVECESLVEVDAALAAGADILLLDNMDPSQLAAAVRRVAGRVITEASGNVTLESVRAVAETGVDLISVGAITHSAPAVDICMRIGQTAC